MHNIRERENVYNSRERDNVYKRRERDNVYKSREREPFLCNMCSLLPSRAERDKSLPTSFCLFGLCQKFISSANKNISNGCGSHGLLVMGGSSCPIIGYWMYIFNSYLW